MAERKETYIGNSKLKNSPEKPLKVILGEQIVKSKNIADGAVTKGKLGDKSVEWENISEDVQNIIASMEKGGVALSGEFGDSELIGINQKKLTEVIGPEGTITQKVASLEETVGEGGSIDERITTAKSELIDGATEEGDTFKKIEDRLSNVEESVGEGGSVDERIAAGVSIETNRAQAAEELLREAYESLSQSQPIPKTAEEWAAMTSWEEGVIYRVAGTTSYTDYMYNGTTTIPMATYNNAIDNEPTAGSDNLVKSGGTLNKIVSLSEKSYILEQKGAYSAMNHALVISNNTVTYTSGVGSDVVCYRKVKKNDILFFEGKGTSSYPSGGKCIFAFFSERPAVNVSSNYYKSIPSAQVVDTEVVVKLVSPIDGWFAWYFHGEVNWDYNGVRDVVDLSTIKDAETYIEEHISINSTTNKIVDAAEWNDTFGQEIEATTPSSFGLSDYIDVTGCKYLKLRVNDVNNESLRVDIIKYTNYKLGSVFYDASKNPISAVNNIRVVWVSGERSKVPASYSYVVVPENAAYIRIFNYISSINSTCLLKTIKTVSTDGIYDVSVYHPTSGIEGGNTYTLAGAIAQILESEQHGGMNISFINPNDEYVQYHLKTDSWSADVNDWENYSEEIYAINEELENKANKNGNYPKMIVGASDALTKGLYNADKYIFRPTANTTDIASGIATLEKIQGNARAWNQLYNDQPPTAIPTRKYLISEKINGEYVRYIDTTISYFEGSTERMCIDLTLIYKPGNEPTEVSVVENDFYEWFGRPLEYEPYNAGDIFSAKLVGIKTTGFNLYNGEYAKVIGGKEYQITGTYTSISLDGEPITPDSNGIFTPAKDGQLVVSGGGSNTCIHFTHDGSRNGEYEEYWEEILPINVTQLTGKLNGEGESIVVAPDGLLSAGTVYDTVEVIDGKLAIVKRIRAFDLGDITWDKATEFSKNIFRSNSKGITYKLDINSSTNCICSQYKIASTLKNNDKGIIPFSTYLNPNGRIEIADAEKDNMTAAQFKEAVKGIKLYCSRAVSSPLVYVLDSNVIPANYKVDNWGTEEIVSLEDSVSAILHIYYNTTGSAFVKKTDVEQTVVEGSNNPVSGDAVHKALKPLNDKNIGSISKSRRILEDISQAMYNYSSDGTLNSRLGLLHYSDWHESSVAADLLLDWDKKIQAFYEEIGGAAGGSFVTDIINTGDVVQSYLSSSGMNPMLYFEIPRLAAKSLFVNGNHDQAYSETSINKHCWLTAPSGPLETLEDTVAASHEFSYNRYFKDFYESWGVTMPTGYDDPSSPYYQACYWHKDYADQKVRLIGIDCMYRFDGILAKDSNGDFIYDNDNMLAVAVDGEGYAKLTTEQETWLYNKLNETLDSNNAAYGYSVIVIGHYPLDDCDGFNTLNGRSNSSPNGGIILNYKTNDPVCFHYGSSDSPLTLDYRFNMRNRVKTSTSLGWDEGDINNIGDIIQKWQDNGGNFIAWICGHTHADRFYYPKKYPNLLTIVSDRAGEKRSNAVSRRNVNEDSCLCANFYAIDTSAGLIKIVRLGLTTNRLLRSIENLCYDYVNKVVVNEG